MTVKRPLPRILPLLGVACAALTLAACGSSSPQSSSASSDDAKRVAFEDCLRAHGVDVRTTSDGRVMMRQTVTNGADQGGLSRSTDRSLETCHKQTGWAPRPPSDAQRAEFRDRALRFAQCMRAHGVDMADPSSDGRMTLRIDGSSPTARSATRACGGPGGPGGFGVSAKPAP